MKTSRLIIAAAILAAVGLPGTASAARPCKPVIGHFQANVVPPGEGHCPPAPDAFCTAGRVWGGIQGDYEFLMTGALPADVIGGVPTVLFFSGQSTVLLRNGDELFGVDTGSIDLPPGQGGFASLITFDGGTGGTSTASGQIRLRGDFDAAAGTTSGDYIGTLCRE